eukprot:2540261-Prymnesium_polylepis.2
MAMLRQSMAHRARSSQRRNSSDADDDDDDGDEEANVERAGKENFDDATRALQNTTIMTDTSRRARRAQRARAQRVRVMHAPTR